MTGLPGFHNLREEILERIWSSCGERSASREVLDELGEEDKIHSQLQGLLKEGLISGVNGTVTLTDEGKALGRHVVRANRLAARLLHDLLELPPDIIGGLACRLEHAISPELADSLCTLLGHPPTAPTGHPIPRGRCCEALSQGVGPMVRPLPELDLGACGRITFIHPRFTERLDHLSSLGIVPGTDIRLSQHHPSIVVEVGATTLALDSAVARDIYVKPLT